MSKYHPLAFFQGKLHVFGVYKLHKEVSMSLRGPCFLSWKSHLSRKYGKDSLSLRGGPQLSTHRSTVYLYLALLAFLYLYQEPEPTSSGWSSDEPGIPLLSPNLPAQGKISIGLGRGASSTTGPGEEIGVGKSLQQNKLNRQRSPVSLSIQASPTSLGAAFQTSKSGWF